LNITEEGVLRLEVVSSIIIKDFPGLMRLDLIYYVPKSIPKTEL